MRTHGPSPRCQPSTGSTTGVSRSTTTIIPSTIPTGGGIMSTRFSRADQDLTVSDERGAGVR